MTLGEPRAASAVGSEARAATGLDFRTIFEHSAAPCLLLLPDAPRFSVTAATHAYLAFAHATLDATVGAPLGDVLERADIVVDAEELEALQASLARAISQRSVTRHQLDGDDRTAPRSGAARRQAGWAVVTTPVLSGWGEVTHLLQRFEPADAALPDASETQRNVEQQLAKCTRELAECTRELAGARAELEAFSYSVAHDLRAPLRAIDGFSQALEQDHGDALGAEAGEYLERIRAGARRMSEQLDDMLELSRIQRTPMRKATLDVSELARRVVDTLRRQSPERVVAVDIAPELRVHADSHLTTVLLEKLLGNAWKFTSKNPHASIQLGIEPGADGTTLFVADDGVGFDMTGAERLFTPFQRLHRATDFGGTGMGLAIAHRIVMRHGGRIWARAEVGKGARFHWTVELASASGRRR
ncbi:MAG TPA: ATP-binding protein [Polyangiaceae bacterium]|nr:ATP-binding protein [Polyangiaceae bacterium]